LRSRRKGKKTESSVALFHQPRIFHRPVAHCEFGFAAVLCDDEGVGRERPTATSTAEEVQRTGVLCFGFIGRIDVDQIDKLRDLSKPLQHRTHASILDRESSADLQRGEILTNRCQRRLCIFCKPYVGGTTAQRLDSNGSRASVEIDKATAADSRRDDIEEPLAQTIACGPGLKTARSNELTGAVSACNNAHLSMV